MMKRVILDTNIYGFILEKDDPDTIEELISKSDIIIYGLRVIRKELRDAPKKSTIYDRSRKVVRNLRNSLLALYDTVAKKEYGISGKMKTLAGEYYTAYREVGGKEKWEELENDFIIIACASIYNLDIVVSNDNETMLSGEAMKAYRIVNALRKFRVPEFIGYSEFRRSLPL
ncbi:MAG: hypothetical protein AABX14_02100 [Candidatus Aenigmatarchaeota archaeon]